MQFTAFIQQNLTALTSMTQKYSYALWCLVS